MCKARQKLAGIVRAQAQAAQLIHIPGYSGIVAVEYRGKRELDRLPTSLDSGAQYRYGLSRPRFYVDARDISRTLAWSENGERVFFIVSGLSDNGKG